MVYKRYYSPFEERNRQEVRFNEPEIIKPQKLEQPKFNNEEQHEHVKCNCPNCTKAQSAAPFGFLSNGFLSKIGNDDLILLGLIVILLLDDKENIDLPLILALGFIFIMQYIEN